METKLTPEKSNLVKIYAVITEHPRGWTVQIRGWGERGVDTATQALNVVYDYTNCIKGGSILHLEWNASTRIGRGIVRTLTGF